MKKWMKPAMEVVEVDMNDVIATSLNGTTGNVATGNSEFNNARSSDGGAPSPWYHEN